MPAATTGGSKGGAAAHLARPEVKGMHRTICFATTCLSTQRQNQPIEFLNRLDPTEVHEREGNKKYIKKPTPLDETKKTTKPTKKNEAPGTTYSRGVCVKDPTAAKKRCPSHIL